MEHHTVAEVVGFLRRDGTAQLLFHLEGVFASVGDAQPSGDADAVGVADVALLPVDVAQNEIGGLAAHAGQRQQIVHVVGDFAAEPRQQLLGGGNDIPGLGPPEAAGLDVPAHLVHIGGGEGLQRRVAGEQRRCYQIHPGVGTLGRQPHGKQQLVVFAVVQRAGRVGVQLLQRRDDGGDLLCRFHGHHLDPIITAVAEKRQSVL